jgi:hypothetical protein
MQTNASQQSERTAHFVCSTGYAHRRFPAYLLRSVGRPNVAACRKGLHQSSDRRRDIPAVAVCRRKQRNGSLCALALSSSMARPVVLSGNDWPPGINAAKAVIGGGFMAANRVAGRPPDAIGGVYHVRAASVGRLAGDGRSKIVAVRRERHFDDSSPDN